MTALQLDMDARYTVNGMPGVAWWLKGYVTSQPECEGHPEDDFGGTMGESYYCDGTCQEPQADESQVVAVMVGDDREHTIDVDDLTVIGDDDYCSCCGQVGCTWDGR
jgi:hypothetical protein